MVKLIMYTLAAITILASSAITPAMGEISMFFAGENTTLVKLIVTITAFFVIPGSFLSLILCKYFGRKKTLLGSLFLYGFAGCLTGFFSNIYLMLLTRSLLGLAVGILMPINQALPADLFSVEERPHVITMQFASGAMGNLVFTIIVGLLSLISWRYTFFVYAVAFPLFIITYFYLPDIKYEESVNSEKSRKAFEILPLKSYIITFQLCISMIVVYAFYIGVAMLADVRGLGNTSNLACIFALGALTAFTTSCNLHRLRKLFGRFFVAIACFLLTISYTLVYFADSLYMLAVAIVFIAYAIGSMKPIAAIGITNSVKYKEQVIQGMAMLTTAMFLGQFQGKRIKLFLRFPPKILKYIKKKSSFKFLIILV